MAREWEPRVGDATDVQKLVHLAMRKTQADVEAIRGELLKRRQIAYEDELTRLAAKVGCSGRRGRLTTGASLTELNEQSKEDAGNIVNTYNYDLMVAIEHITSETPTANRHVYAKRLKDWEDRRAGWKEKQIAEYTDGKGRALALRDFYRFNDVRGVAILEPRQGVCPVCVGWIQRKEVPLNVAQNHPPPYHVNCPHGWRVVPDKVSRDECPMLWVGE